MPGAASDVLGQGRAASPPRAHIRHVEGLRAVAALIVFVNHAYAQTWNPDQGRVAPGLLSWFSYSLIFGHLSVTVFIVVSGFCLALPVVAAKGELRGGAGPFFKRRARRILPPYYAAAALSLALIATILGKPTGTIWDVPILVNKTSVLSHLLLLQDLYGTGSINYVLWSIAVEWHIYFFFPLLVWAWRRFGPGATVAAALVFGYALRFGLGSTRVARANPQYLGMFAFGMLAAYVAMSPDPIYARIRSSAVWTWAGAVGLLASLAMIAAWGINLSHERFHLLDFPMGIMAASLLVLSTRDQDGLWTRALSVRPLVVIGTFSYSLYLLHAPLLQIVWQYVLHPLGVPDVPAFALLMTIGLAFVLAASYAFFRAFEEPFMRKPARPALPALSPEVEPANRAL